MDKINYDDYLKSEHWLELREEIYKRDGHRCRLCNSDKNICVHHRTYENLGNEDLNDLITLCKGCHSKFHGKNNQDTKTELVDNRIIIQEQKAQKEQREYYSFIEDNINFFDETYSIINKNNYVLYKNFYEDLCKLCKKTIYKPFYLLYYFFKYYSMVCVCMYNQTVIDKYNFPPKSRTRQKNIIIKEQLYNDNYKDIVIVHHAIL